MKALLVVPGEIEKPEWWDASYPTGETVTVNRDSFEWTENESDYSDAVEKRQLPDPNDSETLKWRHRIRTETEVSEYSGGIGRIYRVSDERLPGGGATFYWVDSTGTKLKELHEYVYTELGYGPGAGILAVLGEGKTFLPHAVRNAFDYTLEENLARLTTLGNWLGSLGYDNTPFVDLYKDAVAGDPTADEHRLVESIVETLGFEMDDLFKTMI
jgi:hypothetical protein